VLPLVSLRLYFPFFPSFTLLGFQASRILTGGRESHRQDELIFTHLGLGALTVSSVSNCPRRFPPLAKFFAPIAYNGSGLLLLCDFVCEVQLAAPVVIASAIFSLVLRHGSS